MVPDFNKIIIETVAKRAAYKCSNPDCCVLTVGPNSKPDKATLIGEAAHIFGARPNSKRYNHEMNDTSRAEITNAIWLCRNCHKLIDTDENRYSSDLLFKWRENHENQIITEIGNKTDIIVHNEKLSILQEFKDYPPIIRRIILDKPDGWEFSITAELLKYFNTPLFRKIEDLRDGLYIKNQKYIDREEIDSWLHASFAELSNIAKPVTGLLDRLTKSWGEPGEPGDLKEIHHITILIREYLKQVVELEEKIAFVNVPNEYEKILSLLRNSIGSQAIKLSCIPNDLYEIISLAKSQESKNSEKPLIINKTITFDVPEGWETQIEKELKKLKLKKSSGTGSGCSAIATIIIIIILLIIFI